MAKTTRGAEPGMNLKERPAAMIGPTLSGVSSLMFGVAGIVTGNGLWAVVGMAVFVAVVVYWVVYGFVVDPKR